MSKFSLDDGDLGGNSNIQRRPPWKIGTNFDRQLLCANIYKQWRRAECTSNKVSQSHLFHSSEIQKFHQRQLSRWKTERSRRPPVPAIAGLRMVPGPTGLSDAGGGLGATPNRQIRQRSQHKTSSLQLPFLGAGLRGHRCPSSGLEGVEQLHKPPIPHARCSYREGVSVPGGGHCDSSVLAQPNVVSPLTDHTYCATSAHSNRQNRAPNSFPESRGDKESKMEAVCLEDIWGESLRARRWPERACLQYKFCLAASTMSTYNRYITKFHELCRNQQVKVFDEPTLVLFLCDIADGSDRPKSALNCARAALSHMFLAYGLSNPLSDPWVCHLITALIKSGTSEARTRSNVIPVAPIRELFSTWPPNSQLDTKRLRLKCITTLALALMLRPSDIAPRGTSYCPSSGVSAAMTFKRSHIQFWDDGTASVTFHGIKNDTLRDGFIVALNPSSCAAVCPVAALKEYLARTANVCPSPDSPVFVTLRRPYNGLSAQAVANILNEALSLVGLHNTFSAKDFRPTGATVQVQEGVDPKTVMKVGRWKTESVFFYHYVHSQPPVEFSDNVLLS